MGLQLDLDHIKDIELVIVCSFLSFTWFLWIWFTFYDSIIIADAYSRRNTFKVSLTLYNPFCNFNDFYAFIFLINYGNSGSLIDALILLHD